MKKKFLLFSLFAIFLLTGFAAANKVNPTMQEEIKYYEKLKNCIPSKISNGSIMFQTYGKNGRMCSFEMKEKDPITNKFISNCRVLAPVDATKAFADRKIQFVQYMAKYSDNRNKPDEKALVKDMDYLLNYIKYVNEFATKYCQK